MSAPRVLLSGVVLAQPMGGVRRHNRELLPRVAKLLAAEGGSLAVLEGREPVPFELPPAVERLPSRVPARPALVRATLEGRALRERLAGGRFDLVHTAHLPVPRHLPVPFTLTLHDLKSLALRHTPFSRRLIGRRVIGDAVERCAAVIVVSEALREELCERFGTDPAKVHVVRNGGDHLPILPRSKTKDAPLVAVGHVEPRKNLELLLRALALDAGLPELVVAGASVHGERERLERLAVELGVAARVTFLGLVDDGELARLYARAACVVLPSSREGFCIPAVEAQRARAPLAVSNLPALLEVTGGLAPSFDPADAGACARAVRTALEPATADLEAAAEHAARYTWDASARAWVEVWRRVALTGTR